MARPERKLFTEVPNSSEDATKLRLSFREFVRDIAPHTESVLAHAQSEHGDFLEQDLVDMDFDTISEDLGRNLQEMTNTNFDELVSEVMDVMAEIDIPTSKKQEIAFYIAKKLGFQPKPEVSRGY